MGGGSGGGGVVVVVVVVVPQCARVCEFVGNGA